MDETNPSTRDSNLDQNAGGTNVIAPKPVQTTVIRSQACVRGTCARCRQMVKPLPDSIPNFKTHLIAILLFIIGLPFFCFVPYCIDCFGKPVLRCPKCGAFMPPPPPPPS